MTVTDSCDCLSRKQSLRITVLATVQAHSRARPRSPGVGASHQNLGQQGREDTAMVDVGRRLEGGRREGGHGLGGHVVQDKPGR